MPKTYPSTRRPAELVKCPFCDWKGSARGLHSHSRLMHNKVIKDAKEVKINPYSVKKTKSIKSSISGTSTSTPPLTLETLLIGVGIGLIARWLKNEIDNKTFQSECKKLKLDSNFNRTASQNIKSPQRPTTTPPLK